MSIFAAFRSFAFFRNHIFIAKGRGIRGIRENIYTFRSLSRFRFFSQSYILSRKDAEYAEYAKNIYHFSQPFALSLFFAILYFIAKGHGKREIRGKHMSIFEAFRSFSFFAIIYFIAKERGIRGIREKHISLFAAFRSFAFFRNPLFYRERTRNTRNTRKPYVTFRSLSRFRFFFRNHIFIAKGRGIRGIRENIYTFRIIFDFSRFFAIGSTLADYY